MSGTRTALLVGNAHYPADPGLPDLACPLNDVAGLADQLRNPARGAFDRVEVLADAESAAVRRALVALLRGAGPEDTVLLYYSGHGKLDDAFALHLCTKDTETALLEATSVPMGFVWDLEGKCRAQRKVILLDCCYSGAAGRIRARGHATDRLRAEAGGAGTYLLTASDAVETAQEREGERYGVFTKHLIGGIESGEADLSGEGRITMDDLYDWIGRRVPADAPQRPTRQAGGQGEIVIAFSGRDSRKDRAAALRRQLFGRVAEGVLASAIAERAVAVARMRPVDMAPAERAIDAALDDFLADRIALADLGERIVAAGAPGPSGPWAAPAAGPAAGFAEPVAAFAAPKASSTAQRPPALSGLASPRLLNYGLPAGIVALLYVIGQMAVSAGQEPNAPLLAAIAIGAPLWNLSRNRASMSVGGIVANAAVVLLGGLILLAWFLP